MTIHSPSSDIYKMFDRLLLLMEGREIYQGGLKPCLDYFKQLNVHIPRHANPADVFMMLLSTKSTASDAEQLDKKNFHKAMMDRYVQRVQPQIEIAI